MATFAAPIDFLWSGLRIPTTDAPMSGYTAIFFNTGISTRKNAYEDKDKQSAVTKTTLDANGRVQVFGDGIYDIKVYSADPDLPENAGLLPTLTFTGYKVGATVGQALTILGTRFGTVDDILILADTSSGGFIYDLPNPAFSPGQRIIIRKTSSANTLTVTCTSGGLVDSGANKEYTFITTVEYINDGTNWYSNQADADTVDGVHAKIVSIGAWNMDTTATASIAHGLTLPKIRSVSISIIRDDQARIYPIEHAAPGINGGLPSGNWYSDGTYINIERYSTGLFDGTDFDSLSNSRGYITIQYVD